MNRKNIIWFFNLFVCMLLTAALRSQEKIRLYEGAIPGNQPGIKNEETSTNTEGIVRISRVSEPEIEVYHPAAPVAIAGRGAVIICPGGGYRILASSHEGSDVAAELTSWGLTAVVLKYRLPDDSVMSNKSVAPLQDVQRAIQIVRANAAAWQIDAKKIGVMGFSAGGHLAASAATWYGTPQIQLRNKESVRPDFSILIYPVISFTDSLTHAGSRQALLGDHPAKQQLYEYSNEQKVTAKTPPAFLVHAADDKAVSAENSVVYYQALRKHGVAAELHIYQHGGHGFGMNNSATADRWMDRLKNWLRSNKLL